MGLLFPTALGLTALAIPIIIFYMLRLRRRPAQVSSLLLWQRVLQDYQANAPWQRLQRNLLLLLQLVLLALLILALSRPYRLIEAKVQGNVIILIDASASMQATDVTPNRLAAARNEAIDIINALQGGNLVSLIMVGEIPTPLISGDAGADRNSLIAALDQIDPTTSVANWEAALALAAASATSQPNSTVVVISDGAIPTNLPPLPVPVRWIPIGEHSNNQAIVALATREGRSGTELFVRVMNFADTAVETLLEIRVDGQLFDARNLNLRPAPDGNLSLTFTNLPPTTSYIEAHLAQDDALLLDNVAQTYRTTLGGRVLLVGPGNLFLERSFSLLPGVSLFQAQPDNLPTGEDFDLIIFDRNVPETLPTNTAALLFIAPPTSTDLFEVTGVFTTTRLAGEVDRNHPVTQFVDFSNLHIAQAQEVERPVWATTLLNSQGGPLIMVGETETQRVAIMTFNLLQSDLPLQIDFPILVVNLAFWLFDQPALAAQPLVDNTAASENPLNATESNITPNQAQIHGVAQAEINPPSLQGQQEFWWLLAVAALGILLWEWWVYWRGDSF